MRTLESQSAWTRRIVIAAAMEGAPEPWTVPVRLYFRRNGQDWRLAGGEAV